jgi:hypothetical protein
MPFIWHFLPPRSLLVDLVLLQMFEGTLFFAEFMRIISFQIMIVQKSVAALVRLEDNTHDFFWDRRHFASVCHSFRFQ